MPNVPRVFVVAQARIGSTRLPGKVLRPLAGRPIVQWVLARASRAHVEGVILAIPDGTEDDVLAQFADEGGWQFFRGSAEDVQARYLAAAAAVGALELVRLTCDNPFVDAVLVDGLVSAHLRAGADYSAYHHGGNHPVGLAVEVFSVSALARAREIGTHAYEREHVTPGLYQRPEAFKIHAEPSPFVVRRGDLRMTIDTLEDLEAMERLVDLVRNDDPMNVDAERYARLLGDHPEIRAVNAHVRQKSLGE